MTIKGKTYTTNEIAELCDVYPSTVISWIKRDRIKAFSTPGGHRRVLEEDLLGFLKKFGLPLPAHLKPGRKRVLIAEDEKAVGRMLMRVFQGFASDLEAAWVPNGIDALLVLGKQPPDLLVLDVAMPVMDGVQVLSSLRSDPQTRNVRVIGVTGKRLPPDKLGFMRRHADAFFLKPFDVKAFADRAAELLNIPGRIGRTP